MSIHQCHYEVRIYFKISNAAKYVKQTQKGGGREHYSLLRDTCNCYLDQTAVSSNSQVKFLHTADINDLSSENSWAVN